MIKNKLFSKSNNEVILVTGGAGFIGSNYLNIHVPLKKDTIFVNVDCLTYAGSLKNIKVADCDNYFFEKVDIRDIKKLERIFKKYKPNGVINFAAESHVDLSIKDPGLFFETNVVGTHNLLLMSKKFKVTRFFQISTDEVYGSIPKTNDESKETDVLRPTNPYSASKASAEMIALAYHQTFGLDVVVSRSSNNYGPNQDSSKLIPKFIKNLIKGIPVPLYGKGEQRRNWLHVFDNVRAVESIYRKGKAGEIYNIGGGFEISNLELTRKIIKLAKRDDSFINFVTDRLGHDFRYSISIDKIKKELGWKPEISFDEGILKTFDFYKGVK